MATAQRLYHKGHYNIIASEIRELWPIDVTPSTSKYNKRKREDNMVRRGVLAQFALNMAKRFKKDYPGFRHLQWLDSCTPDPDSYPLSELWEDENAT